jgi:chemosensory pili system protein ChpE
VFPAVDCVGLPDTCPERGGFMLTLFLTAFTLGFVFNAAPGAVFAETIRQGARGGFRPALAVQCGSLAGDALWAVLGLLGVGLLLRLGSLRLPIGIAGAVYLMWLAWDAWRAADHAFAVGTAQHGTRTRRALRSGVLLSITNPQNVAYWAALGSALGAVGVREPTVSDYAVFFAGFMVSSVVWSVVCAALVDRLFRRAGVRWVRLT